MGIAMKTALIGLAFIGIAAHADTIRTFSLNGASIFYGMAGDTNTVSGTVTIDTTTGIVQTISVLAGGISQSGVDSQQGLTVFVGTSLAKISFDAGTLQDYMGSTFDLNGPNDLYVGHITAGPVLALTPEPGSLILFSTGLLGIAAAARRRLYFGA